MQNTRCKQEIHTREQLGFRYRWENNIKWTLEKYGMKVRTGFTVSSGSGWGTTEEFYKHGNEQR